VKQQTFDRNAHVCKNDSFAELVKDAIIFFNGTPVHTPPPSESFLGTGDTFYITPAKSTSSPLNIEGVDLGLSSDDIVDLVQKRQSVACVVIT
jgi:hypothetical protein